MSLPDILPFAHYLLRQQLRAGDNALDGTMGRGRDTLLLAQCVGAGGRVFAFDIQTTALAATDRLLREAGVRSRAVLHGFGHQHLSNCVPAGIRAAVFNFGYLPGGNKALTTQPHTSLKAFQAALHLLAPDGLLVAVLYPGHTTGRAEARWLADNAATLSPQRFTCAHYHLTNRRHAPFVLAVHKHSD